MGALGLWMLGNIDEKVVVETGIEPERLEREKE